MAGCLLACLGCFFSVNLHNIVKHHKHNNKEKPHAEVEHPSGILLTAAALGTIIYFVESLLHPLLVLTDHLSLLDAVSLHFQESFTLFTQGLGLTLTTIGYLLFMWSVIARGRYATSWEMRKSHRLVTWGPYHYVRHPSYFAYFLMFMGFFIIWPNPLTLIPLVAIPGYFKVTVQEEKLLEQRFGDEYEEYQKKTGRFIPKFRQRACRILKKKARQFSFITTYENLKAVLTDHDLASLGDAFINFTYSLALSNRRGRPSGAKVKGTLLAEALRRAGLREYLPSRMTSHTLADAAEAVIVYAWLNDHITLEETVATLENNKDPVEGLGQLLEKIKNRIKLS